MIIQGVSSKDIFLRGNIVKGYIQQLILLTTATCSMYATYICFSSWSKRSELRKESEEDKVKLLDMCSASEANKELIHHKVRGSDKQTYVRDFQFLPQRRLTNFAFCIGRQATSNTKKLLFQLSVEHVVILLKHRFCGLKLHEIYTQMYPEKYNWFSNMH